MCNFSEPTLSLLTLSELSPSYKIWLVTIYKFFYSQLHLFSGN